MKLVQKKAAGGAQKEGQSKDLSKITDLSGKLYDLLVDPSPDIAAWHETVGILMRKLRDELNVVLDTTPLDVKERQRQVSQDLCGND